MRNSKTSDIAEKRLVAKSNPIFDDPPPSFLSICRYLVTLEQHISKYSNDISRLFSLSLEFERKEAGSSNELLTADNMKFLAELQIQIKEQIVLGILPQQMHRIAKSFVNDLARLVQKNAEKKEKMLIDIEMPQI